MKKILVILLCVMALTSCEKEEVITCYVATPEEIEEISVTVTNIVDATKTAISNVLKPRRCFIPTANTPTFSAVSRVST